MTVSARLPNGSRALRIAAPILLLPLLLVVWLHVTAGERTLLFVNDLGELFYAALAAGTAGWRAVRSQGRLRKAWIAFAAGCAAWAVGEAIWSWYDLRGLEPFPSPADVGFLTFPVLACLGLLLYPGRRGGSRANQLLGALTATVSLTLIGWSLVLEALFAADATDRLTFVVAVAYPAMDLMVLILCLLRLATFGRRSLALWLIAMGLASITIADAAYAVLAARGLPLLSVIDLGWWLGFALLALAPFAPVAAADLDREQADEEHAFVLPYLPAFAATGVLLFGGIQGHRLGIVDVILFLLLAALSIVRQFRVMRENDGLIHERTARELEVRFAAFHDALTGLANRALFHDRVAHALELHGRCRRPLAVLFCDLDDFKVVNDTYGHAAGDALLTQVADRWRGVIRSGDTLARLGGDEFAVLLEDGGEAAVTAARLCAAMSVPFSVGGRLLAVQASVGVTVVTEGAPVPTLDTVLSQADTAMYAVKRAGKGGLRMYEPGMALTETEEATYLEPLLETLLTKQLGVVYQPIVDLDSGAVVGVEALARWSHAGVVVPPSIFVPIAERAGLARLLTDVVLEASLDQLAVWNAILGHRTLTVAVNVPAQLFIDPTFPGRVQAALEGAGLCGTQLVLELTESALLADPEAAREIATELRQLGVQLSLDDFGTGYSSLVHLKVIELDLLKIDRAFLEGIEGARQANMVKAILAFGRDLGLEVIAEGVERPDQLQCLRALGCDFAQGYLLGRPSTAEDLLSLLVRQARPPRPVPAAPRSTSPAVAGAAARPTAPRPAGLGHIPPFRAESGARSRFAIGDRDAGSTQPAIFVFPTR